MDKFLYGVAYYDEYMPYDRIEEDFRMMKKAGFNVICIAESTWSTLQPKPDIFDFTHIDRIHTFVVRKISSRGIPLLAIALPTSSSLK